MKNLYRLETPYPVLSEKSPNRFYVSLLLNLYASSASEMTAVLQYAYQSHYFKTYSEELEKVITGISIVEMQHINLLQNAIMAFGGQPKYISPRGIYYSARSVDYASDFAPMLLSDISSEKAAVKAYKDAAELVSDNELKELLLRIMEDEELHCKILEGILLQTK